MQSVLVTRATRGRPMQPLLQLLLRALGRLNAAFHPPAQRDTMQHYVKGAVGVRSGGPHGARQSVTLQMRSLMSRRAAGGGGRNRPRPPLPRRQAPRGHQPHPALIRLEPCRAPQRGTSPEPPDVPSEAAAQLYDGTRLVPDEPADCDVAPVGADQDEGAPHACARASATEEHTRAFLVPVGAPRDQGRAAVGDGVPGKLTARPGRAVVRLECKATRLSQVAVGNGVGESGCRRIVFQPVAPREGSQRHGMRLSGLLRPV